MIKELHAFDTHTRRRNLERRKRECLVCNRSFTTTAVSRICGKCHKIVDRVS